MWTSCVGLTHMPPVRNYVLLLILMVEHEAASDYVINFDS